MDILGRDLKHAIRQLVRSPGFALVTLLTLALGIGANTAIFSIVRGVVLKPLGYPEPERLVLVTSQFPSLGFDQFWISPPEFLELRERSRAFESMGAYATGDANLAAIDRPRRVRYAQVSTDLFTALGVAPLAGRTFESEETLPGAPRVIVLSEEIWRSAFQANPRLVGETIELNGAKRTVVGIMPRGFDVFDEGVEVWLPLPIDPANRQNRGNHYLYLVGRLKRGVSLAGARAEIDTLLAQWPIATPNTHTPNQTTHRLRVDPLHEEMIGGARTAVWVLQAAVLFVLLIACANLANLLLARAESRQREFAVRSALGAGRGRLLRQFMTEGLLLSVTGGALGLALAGPALQLMLQAHPESLPRAREVAIDPQALLFTLVVAVGTGVLFGLAPLLHLAPASMSRALSESGQRGGSSRLGMRRLLVMGEVAIAVLLVTGAGLFLQTLWNLMRVEVGFDRSRLVTFELELPNATYPQATDVAAFYGRLINRLGAIPGVESVAAMSGLPPLRDVNANDTDIDGYTRTGDGPAENIDYWQNVTTGYTETMGIALVEGRSFEVTDAAGPPVVLVNETMARTFWPGTSPVGRRVRPGFDERLPWFTVVGVVRDVKQGGIDKKIGTELYFNVEQTAAAVGFTPRGLNLVLRSRLPLTSLAGSIQETVGALDRSLPIVKLRPMEDVFAETLGRPRLLADLLLAFAALALLLAAIGTYGILSYLVAERRREIGIRMALGAARSRVMGMVLGHGMKLTIVGLVVGLAAVSLLSRLLTTLLFGVRPFDPLTLAAVAVVIALVAVAACYVPARRATRVDPMTVLREE